jgi:hypothetical protein
LGAGYSPSELKTILEQKDFRDFFDANRLTSLVNLWTHKGLYKAQSFTDWLDTLLAQKTKSHDRVMLSDLPHRVTVYASRREKRALKFDSRSNDAAAAYAARCSMSYPFVFTPQSDQGMSTYDGGLQNNYPVEALLKDHRGIQFISLFLGCETYMPIQNQTLFGDLISIWTEATDMEVVEKYRDRTVIIDTQPVDTLDFDLSSTEKKLLVACGRAGALAHLAPKSIEYEQAVQERDQLKAEVGDQRRAKRQRRWRRLKQFLLLGLVGLVALIIWWFWPATCSPLGMDMPEFLRRKSTAFAQNNGAEFKQKSERKCVDWQVEIVRVYEPNQTYIVKPVGGETTEQISLRFKNPEQDFDKMIKPGTTIRVQAEVGAIGSGSVLLRNAELVK